MRNGGISVELSLKALEAQIQSYPNLMSMFYSKRGTPAIQRVYAIMMDESNKHSKEPAAYIDGKPIIYASMRYIAQRYKQENTTRQCTLMETSRLVHMLCALGMIKLCKYDITQQGMVNSIALAKYYERQTETKWNAIRWYYVNEVNEDTLKFAEEVATAWKQSRLSLKDINRYTMMQSLGIDAVERAYYNMLTDAEQDYLDSICTALQTAIKSTIAAKGYAYAADIVKAATDATGAPYSDVQWLWTHTRKIILKKAGSKYKRPTNQDMIRFGLQSRYYIYCI